MSGTSHDNDVREPKKRHGDVVIGAAKEAPAKAQGILDKQREFFGILAGGAGQPNSHVRFVSTRNQRGEGVGSCLAHEPKAISQQPGRASEDPRGSPGIHIFACASRKGGIQSAYKGTSL